MSRHFVWRSSLQPRPFLVPCRPRCGSCRMSPRSEHTPRPGPPATGVQDFGGDMIEPDQSSAKKDETGSISDLDLSISPHATRTPLELLSCSPASQRVTMALATESSSTSFWSASDEEVASFNEDGFLCVTARLCLSLSLSFSFSLLSRLSLAFCCAVSPGRLARHSPADRAVVASGSCQTCSARRRRSCCRRSRAPIRPRSRAPTAPRRGCGCSRRSMRRTSRTSSTR
eukprot:COSAG06_NODE_5430_length_3485_cov_5.309214_1_plen_229_part_00